MNLETQACLSLWRPQLKDLRIRILINNDVSTGQWTLYNRRTKKTLVEGAVYFFSTGVRGPNSETGREVRTKPLSWLNKADFGLSPHHIEALLILKEELNDT